MLIRIGYDIELGVSGPTALITLLRVHPERQADLLGPEEPVIEPDLHVEAYTDLFGNECSRITIPAGIDRVRLHHSALIRDHGNPDAQAPRAEQIPVAELPTDALTYLLPSRYCEVDSPLLDFAWDTFGHLESGWEKVQAVCDFVHQHLAFDYLSASMGRTALRGFEERTGVCRDFTHLAVTLCRCLNIPARYVTGYLTDIGVEITSPMDFHAWFQVYLGGQWHTFDARHNTPRIGRIPIGRGRDAADVPITMVFGQSYLYRFEVTAEEVAE